MPDLHLPLLIFLVALAGMAPSLVRASPIEHRTREAGAVRAARQRVADGAATVRRLEAIGQARQRVADGAARPLPSTVIADNDAARDAAHVAFEAFPNLHMLAAAFPDLSIYVHDGPPRNDRSGWYQYQHHVTGGAVHAYTQTSVPWLAFTLVHEFGHAYDDYSLGPVERTYLRHTYGLQQPWKGHGLPWNQRPNEWFADMFAMAYSGTSIAPSVVGPHSDPYRFREQFQVDHATVSPAAPQQHWWRQLSGQQRVFLGLSAAVFGTAVATTIVDDVRELRG